MTYKTFLNERTYFPPQVLPLVNSLLALACSDRGSKYWLVKTELCRVVGSISFLSLHHLTNAAKGSTAAVPLQTRLFDGVVMGLLGDEDARVRSAASDTVVKAAGGGRYQHKRNFLLFFSFWYATHYFTHYLTLPPVDDKNMVILFVTTPETK